MVWLKGIAGALALLALVLVGLKVSGARRWEGATQALFMRLESTRERVLPARFDPRELEDLPAPVQRFFRLALTPGQAIVAAARIEHRGSFNMGEQGDTWKPFSSRQRVLTRRPGFVWDGRIEMLPGLPVQVHDAYAGGAGILRPALLGLFDLAELQSTPELAQGEFLRYLAEASWYPTALLPSQGVRWEAIDAESARATLADGPVVASLRVHFGPDGLIDRVLADARGRTVGKATVMTPWEGRWSDYQRRDGMQVPQAGEVAWLLPEGRKVYWRGSLTALDYEWAD